MLAQGELAPSGYAFQLCGTAGIININDCMATGRSPHRSRGEIGRATMEVLMAIMESSCLHSTVYLPLETEESPLELMIEAEQI